PEPGEEESLLKEEKVLQNSEKLFQTASKIYQELYEDEGSAYERLSGAVEALTEVRQIDERLSPMTADCKSAAIAVEETAKFLQEYISAFEFNPERLEEIRQRLSEFSHLKKKYGATMAAVLEHQQKIEDELAGIGNVASDMESLRVKFDDQQNVFSEKCQLLSLQRQNAALRLQTFLEASLAELGMSEAVFNIHIKQQSSPEGVALIAGDRIKANRNGIDQVEFLLSANPGSSPRPLVDVASGGEISRVMLALKLAQADADRLPVMIFDEIDTGVSGRIAQAVGRNMRRLSKQHQILCITHLPQIASMGHNHLLVEKFVDNGSTRTVVRRLSNDERIQAVATLLGGDVISPALLNSARELIEEAKNRHDIC
ncbi:DNA repair protein RecN, partial [bacterium]|nr:DNA repair protein RecN [bacterium]